MCTIQSRTGLNLSSKGYVGSPRQKLANADINIFMHASHRSPTMMANCQCWPTLPWVAGPNLMEQTCKHNVHGTLLLASLYLFQQWYSKLAVTTPLQVGHDHDQWQASFESLSESMKLDAWALMKSINAYIQLSVLVWLVL